ncbi:MAG: transketolase [Candidatus Magasanikbacteria bacterium RIFOXYC2_FULL_42_28]|uniref:Transketolase n=1 Tax=Candidatus Magasanikbacteria bacterium RIFOXYC2_FULL_42_28 TaxID=1798704 RepID=A0A1F6NXN4_9BACT|nr:MAG: transketolase [Candidatus Magasanikbacteria bacterium RIFOXYC2_FULL_42_28]
MLATNEIKKMISEILEIGSKSGEGHIPSALSVLDILWVLYDRVLKVDSKNPRDINRDRFILSKGHASLGLYAVLARKNFFSDEVWRSFGSFDSLLGGHPDRNKVPGVEASTGSLGHGFPMAVGMALALRIKNTPARVFALIGDGEANEGTIWESSLLAAHHKLSNLCCIVDSNHSTDRALLVNNLSEKFKYFGWDTIEIDGHDHDEIYAALNTPISREPLAIIANTIKGHGVKMMENDPSWHHRIPSAQELGEALSSLK